MIILNYAKDVNFYEIETTVETISVDRRGYEGTCSGGGNACKT